MNENLTTLDPVSTAANVRKVLNKEGFIGSVITLEPGEETPRREASEVEDQVLFVIEGEITVRFDDVNTILGRDEAMLLHKGREHVIVAGPGGKSRVLRLEVPPRQIITPEILSFDRSGKTQARRRGRAAS